MPTIYTCRIHKSHRLLCEGISGHLIKCDNCIFYEDSNKEIKHALSNLGEHHEHKRCN